MCFLCAHTTLFRLPSTKSPLRPSYRRRPATRLLRPVGTDPFGEITIHGADFHVGAADGHPVAAQKRPMCLRRVLTRPFVIAAPLTLFGKLRRIGGQDSTVTVAHGICSPKSGDLLGSHCKSFIGGDGYFSFRFHGFLSLFLKKI